MLNKININSPRYKLIFYIMLTAVILAVYWQLNQYDFVNLDDPAFVTQNSHVQSGVTLKGLRWAFSTKHFFFWHPLTWLSLMFDSQIFGLNAGGYHLTNLILHMLSTLMLFWLFCRMTGAMWRSAFVAALFAIHPMHVESVAWIAERKDVLSAFFWMLTLCLYVFYTEKPVIKRYMPVIVSFVLALMSKSMVVTLPLIMILLDYWPLKRFESQKGNLILWQFKEKIPFFVLSVVFSIITLYAQYDPSVKRFSLYPLGSRLANAPVSFVTYLEKTFWPRDMAVFYPFPDQLAQWQVLGSTLLIIAVSATVIVMIKRLPCLFVGWMWYAIVIAPVLGIIQISVAAPLAMADRYHYLPSIGIAIMLAWGIPYLIKSENIRKKILFPLGTAMIIILSVLTWKQCGYWKNSIELYSHALQATKNNYFIHECRGITYGEMGQYQLAIEDFNQTIKLKKDYAGAYNGRGVAYYNLGQYQRAIEDYNESIRLKPDNVEAYNNRGIIYVKLGRYNSAIEDLSRAISLKKDNADAYNNRSYVYLLQGNKKLGCLDAQKACESGNCDLLEKSKVSGDCR